MTSTRVPSSHVTLRGDRVRVLVRCDLQDTLGAWLLSGDIALPADAQPCDGGRGGAFRATLPGAVRAVVRPCRRGGWLAPLLGDRYVGRHPRPFEELAVSEMARMRGLAVPEVLAARVVGGLLYRGTVVTAELSEATTLIAALHAASPPARVALAEAAGALVAEIHRVGLAHRDLNMTNLLVCGVAQPPRLAVIDLDRATLHQPPLARRPRRAMLRRLARSAHKLDRAGGLVDPHLIAAFRAAYAAGLGMPCAC